MEDQVPPSQLPNPGSITPEMLAEMKARAREAALMQAQAQRMQPPMPQPQVVYVRRNLTIAELILVTIVACGLVTGVQFTWNLATNVLPRLEIKVK